MDGAMEREEGGSERRREGTPERGRGTGRSEGGKEIGMEVNFKGCTLVWTLTNIQYTLLKTTHNAALAHASLVLGMIHSEHVGLFILCIVMRRSVLFDRWMK